MSALPAEQCLVSHSPKVATVQCLYGYCQEFVQDHATVSDLHASYIERRAVLTSIATLMRQTLLDHDVNLARWESAAVL